MLAQAAGRTVGAGDLAAFAQAAATMPAHPDVGPALLRLKEAGYRMVALSNNPRASCEAQLQHAGIRPFFERVFSVDDEARRYKPAPEAYAAVARALDVRPTGLLMVTCHAFDAMGALSAGLRAALILRPGDAPFKLGKQPELICGDLDALSAALAAA
jgi:2-haloacid dehalogenase